MNESPLGRKLVIGIISLVVMIWIIIPASLDVIRFKKLAKKGIYSIGTVTHIIDDRRSAASVNFTFTYQNKSYVDVAVADKYDQKLVGKRFFVLFYPNHPEIVKMLLDKPVPANISKAPKNGWERIP